MKSESKQQEIKTKSETRTPAEVRRERNKLLLGDVLSRLENNNDVFDAAIRNWGEPSQIIMVIEELSELIKALTKRFREKEGNQFKIMEEFADVLIMLKQLSIVMETQNPQFLDWLDGEVESKLIELKHRLKMSA